MLEATFVLFPVKLTEKKELTMPRGGGDGGEGGDGGGGGGAADTRKTARETRNKRRKSRSIRRKRRGPAKTREDLAIQKKGY